MPVSRSKQTIQSGVEAAFSAVSATLQYRGSFGVVFTVASGATATFTVTDEYGNDITGGADLADVTTPGVRVDFAEGEFNGGSVLVACTSYAGTGEVGAILEWTE